MCRKTRRTSLKLALDALGGDDAPRVTVAGALLALEEAARRKEGDFEVTLIGPAKVIAGHLPKHPPAGLKLLDVPATPARPDDNVNVGDDPASPIRTALRLHSEGRFEAVVSAGFTGAQVLASLHELGKCSGITRPAIGSLMPTARGNCLLIDVGASLVATPHHLVQFAVMGHVYAREILGIVEPRMGLVNVAREAHLGDRAAIEAHRLLEDSGFNFVGFVEGRDIPAGAADVVVTNGFVGNVLLKFAEGLPALLPRLLPPSADEVVVQALGNSFDYHAFGGEPLLGVRGVSIICHGASSARAVSSALMQAARIARLRLHERIEEFLVDKFVSYYSQVKYLRSFRRGLRLHGRSGSTG